ncbi:MAG: pyrimidine reductase family protein [Actinomycetota bacterium]|nr:pyrimidine reductase family protein [Actinomycetota bacterium]
MRRLLPDPADDVDLDEAYAVPPGPAVHLRVNFATTADGAVELDGTSASVSGPADKRVFSTLRGLADVILVGAGTARDEGYGPARPSAERQDRRRAAGLSPVPPIALVSRRLDLDLDSPFFTAAQARPLLFTTEEAPPDIRRAAARAADVVLAGDRSVEVGRVLGELAVRGLRAVLCEGGPRLFRDVVAAGRLDELCLTISPALAGPDRAHLLAGAALAQPQQMELRQLLSADGQLFARYSTLSTTARSR